MLDIGFSKCYHERALKIKRLQKSKEISKMYEVVKVVKGYEIVRMKGTRGFYHVNVREGRGFREFHTFRSIKAATEFIEKTL